MVTEVASGVDALYLSGRAAFPETLQEALEERRSAAEESGEPVSFPLGSEEFWVEPFSFGKYRYRLAHPFGLVGLTPSQTLPMLRVQPFAEFLHGAGPPGALRFFESVGEQIAQGPVAWSLSRLDLFCDVQGWQLEGDDRRRFVCRAARRDLHEEGEAFTGFEFGRRSTKTVCARIYDKSLQVKKKGLDWWPEIWGERYDRSRQVLRVELEIGRQGLKEYGIDSPADGLERAGSVWGSVASTWLRYCEPTADETRSRWPTAMEWEQVQRATLGQQAGGIDRVRAARRRGELRVLVPSFVGYLARIAALTGADDLPSALVSARHLVQVDERNRGMAFDDRVAACVVEEARR